MMFSGLFLYSEHCTAVWPSRIASRFSGRELVGRARRTTWAKSTKGAELSVGWLRDFFLAGEGGSAI